MRAMIFMKDPSGASALDGGRPVTAAQLALRECPKPSPGPGQVLVKISACAVCRTDLHILDGDLTHPKPDLVPGHEIVGRIVERGTDVVGRELGQRVGIPWLGSTCGQC